MRRQRNKSKSFKRGFSSDTAQNNIVYGKNPIEEVLKAGKRQVQEVLFAMNKDRLGESSLGALLVKKCIPCRAVTADELDRITGDGVHQNIVAYVSSLPESSLEELLVDLKEKEVILILDSIQDPQNFGTLCRSALSFGVRYVILPRDRSVKITPAVTKASAGAIDYLNIIFVTNLVRTMEKLKERNIWFYGAALDETAQNLTELKPANRSAIVLGTEGVGLRRLVKETCDFTVKIPMAAGFDSLNVAQAGTVLLYEFGKQIF
ncbi:MAG: 23S rRNA (guanosine(2251)-2'-O)-methyltransferase RlmB [bacterium]|nr:23S rRNA (guanosine(2251)-2'-O)-methyltransferase RlmB [bacterium]MBU1917614.1 23S rRNA (guanosine(2251)-2'-O)-methyltransferase RlmB [bacterium]